LLLLLLLGLAILSYLGLAIGWRWYTLVDGKHLMSKDKGLSTWSGSSILRTTMRVQGEQIVPESPASISSGWMSLRYKKKHMIHSSLPLSFVSHIITWPA
jgi:hypothetical protein